MSFVKRTATGRPRLNDDGTERRPLSTAEQERLDRFCAEPQTVVRKTVPVLRTTLVLPKYNGIGWWFPENRTDQSRLQTVLNMAFFCVATGQTIFFIAGPLSLIYRYGLKAVAGLLLTVPLGAQLDDSFGENYGSAFACVLCLYIHCQVYFETVVYTWLDQAGPVGVGLGYVALLFVVGNTLAWLEKTLGRVCFAGIVHLGLCTQLVAAAVFAYMTHVHIHHASP